MNARSLEDPAYVEKTKTGWLRAGYGLPKRMEVIEFCGTGDPFFGGSADDRPLGIGGSILERSSTEPRAEFETIEQAHEAAKTVSNRRPNSVLGVLPSWH